MPFFGKTFRNACGCTCGHPFEQGDPNGIGECYMMALFSLEGVK